MARIAPSGEKQREFTACWWPVIRVRGLVVVALLLLAFVGQRMIVKSSEQEANNSPVDEEMWVLMNEL